MSQIHQAEVARAFPKPIIVAYNANLANALGSATAGILMSQLLYWHGKGNKKGGWIYKTSSALRLETGLTRYQQETAIKLCERTGILSTKLAGIPATKNFRVNLDRLKRLIPSLLETNKLYAGIPTNPMGLNQQSITKITQENTKDSLGYKNYLETKERVLGKGRKGIKK